MSLGLWELGEERVPRPHKESPLPSPVGPYSPHKLPQDCPLSWHNVEILTPDPTLPERQQIKPPAPWTHSQLPAQFHLAVTWKAKSPCNLTSKSVFSVSLLLAGYPTLSLVVFMSSIAPPKIQLLPLIPSSTVILYYLIKHSLCRVTLFSCSPISKSSQCPSSKKTSFLHKRIIYLQIIKALRNLPATDSFSSRNLSRQLQREPCLLKSACQWGRTESTSKA